MDVSVRMALKSAAPVVPFSSIRPSPAVAAASWLLQSLIVAVFLTFVLESGVVAQSFVSQSLWLDVVQSLGGEVTPGPEGVSVVAPFVSLLLVAALAGPIWNSLAAALVNRMSQQPFVQEFGNQCLVHAIWTWPVALWTTLWIVNLLLPGGPLFSLLVLTGNLAVATMLAGGISTVIRHAWPIRKEAFAAKASTPSPSSRAGWGTVWGSVATYALIFTALNWGLWFNLQIPHGDSAMYEEHLWNLLHGKGFRSYLDQGLFFGEHIQVIHLLLIPLYVLWPSHLLLELCESLLLASCAIPVFLLTRRRCGNSRAASLMAVATLLYFPLHYLDIAIDLKTFRPGSLAVPALLWGLERMERRHWLGMTVCFVIALSGQEDFAVAIAPVGLWLFMTGWRSKADMAASERRRQMLVGGLTCLLATVYLVFAVKVAIPWFRAGGTVHYARYFHEFGETPTEIVWTLLTRPDLLARKLMNAGSVAYFLYLLLPLGMPLRAWDRLLTGLPLFILLCMNELAQSTPGPFHHFHAPLVPLLLWSATAAFPAISTTTAQSDPSTAARNRGIWVCSLALTTGLFFTMSPLGIAFWDSGSARYWKRLYIPDERAREFAKIPPLIPRDARVASTDFVHPRFTHYERSYDYSKYPRRVADYEDKVPDDTEYIVIDTTHRYSEIHSPEEMREFRTQPGQWEIVPTGTNGYYLVLKRIRFPERHSENPPEP